MIDWLIDCLLSWRLIIAGLILRKENKTYTSIASKYSCLLEHALDYFSRNGEEFDLIDQFSSYDQYSPFPLGWGMLRSMSEVRDS